MTEITAELQTGYQVLVVVTGLSTEAPPADTVTIWRVVDGDRSPVRGQYMRLPADPIVASDVETPLGRPITYVVAISHTDGTVSEVATTAPVVVASALPLVSHPITGDSVPVTIESWTDMVREGRSARIIVAGRPDPVMVSDVMTTATSQPVLRTQTAADMRELRGLLAGGQVILLRAPCPGVEDAYLYVTGHTETRYSPADAGDQRRRHTLDAQHVEAPYLAIPAVGTTLADLAAAVPGTLADIAATWSTLLEISIADLEAM